MGTRQSPPAKPETPSPDGLLAAARQLGKLCRSKTWIDDLDDELRGLVLGARDRWKAAGGEASGIAATHLARVIREHVISRGARVITTERLRLWLVEKV